MPLPPATRVPTGATRQPPEMKRYGARQQNDARRGPPRFEFPGVAASHEPPATYTGSGATRRGPYDGFRRRFTDEGGIELSFHYKDDRWWVKLGCFAGWLAFMALYCVMVPDILADYAWWVQGLVLAGVGWFLWYACFGWNDLQGTVEVRPDCLVVDQSDVFWRDNMEVHLPHLVPDGDKAFSLRGTYGTRSIEYLRIHSFDEHDQQPQVFQSHLQFAMEQMWDRPR